MKSFYKLSILAEGEEEVRKRIGTTIDPRFDALIKELMADPALKLNSKTRVIDYVYAGITGDHDKLQRILQVRSPDLADLVRSLTQIGKVINLHPEIHKAFIDARINPSQFLEVLHAALIQGDPDSLGQVLHVISRDIHTDEQKRAVADAFSQFVELKRNYRLKDLLNRWLTTDEEHPQHFTRGPQQRTNFQIDQEDMQSLTQTLERAVVGKGGPDALRVAVGHWVKSNPKIVQGILSKLPGTQEKIAGRSAEEMGQAVKPHEVTEKEEEIADGVMDILQNYGEIERLVSNIRGKSRRDFLKQGVAFVLGGTTMTAIAAFLSGVGNQGASSVSDQEKQKIEQVHKYAPTTIEFRPGSRATYRYDPTQKTLTIEVTPSEEGNQMRLAKVLKSHMEVLGYKISGQPSIGESPSGDTLIAIPNVTDEGQAQPMKNLVRFNVKRMKEWSFYRWHDHRLKNDATK